jgi:hypothetical protein
MKKTAIIAGAAFLLFTATVNAQKDTVPAQQPKTHTDQWNNSSPDKYKMLPMPEALSTEKIFPVIGKYNVTDKDGASTTATIALDPENKGIIWVEGLPQGKIKAYLRKSPGIYKIPVQKTEDGKDIAEGVLIYNKDANTLDVCIGCGYNIEDPTVAFTSTTTTEPEETITKTKTKRGITKTKVKPIKTWKYSGSKVVETTASVAPVQQ